VAPGSEDARAGSVEGRISLAFDELHIAHCFAENLAFGSNAAATQNFLMDDYHVRTLTFPSICRSD
jgi:hypothetical protein